MGLAWFNRLRSRKKFSNELTFKSVLGQKELESLFEMAFLSHFYFRPDPQLSRPCHDKRRRRDILIGDPHALE